MIRARVTQGRVINPCSDLGEIEVFGTQAIADVSFSIGMISRFDSIRVSDPDWSWQVTVKLRRAFIKVKCRGCKIAQEGRAGDRPRAQRIEAKACRKTDLEHHARAGASGSLSAATPHAINIPLSAKLGAEFSASKEARDTSKISTETVYLFEALRALSGDRWVIEDLNSAVLLGRYSPEDDFCTLELTEFSGGLSAYLYFLPSDLELEYSKAESAPLIDLRARPNTTAIVKALIAKELRNLNQEKNTDGRVVLGVSSLGFKAVD